MTKEQFISSIRAGLFSLPEKDIQSSLQYYSEAIDDRMEDGMTEEEAVADIGTVEEVIAQILKDKNVNEEKTFRKTKEQGFDLLKKNKVLTITLLILASPLIFSVFVGLFAIVIAVAATVFSMVAVFYSVPAALGVAGIATFVKAVALIVNEYAVSQSFLYFGVGMILIGCGILLFVLAGYYAKLIKWICGKIKYLINLKILKKEENK